MGGPLPPPFHGPQGQKGFRRSSLDPSSGGTWDTGPHWVPGELLEPPEGDHGAHPLAQRGEAAVHEELGAVSQQVGIGDADGHRHPAGGQGAGMRLPLADLGPQAASALDPLARQHESSPQKGGLRLEVEGTEVRARAEDEELNKRMSE